MLEFGRWHFVIGVLSRVPKTPLAFAIMLDKWHTVIWFVFCILYVRRHEYTSLQLPIQHLLIIIKDIIEKLG